MLNQILIKKVVDLSCNISLFSSTNAYMLMYRKIDKKRNKNFIKKSKWAASLTNLCNSILQDEEDEHSKRERQKNLCKV